MIIIETFPRGATPRHQPTGPMIKDRHFHDSARATMPQMRSLCSLVLGRQ
jgi:hypothetical protein